MVFNRSTNPQIYRLESGTLCKSVLFSFLPKGSVGYAEQVGGFGKVAVGMGYGRCYFALFVAGFEFELDVCAGGWRVEVQLF